MTAKERARRWLVVAASASIVVTALYPPWKRTACENFPLTSFEAPLPGRHAFLWAPPTARADRFDHRPDPAWLDPMRQWTIEARVDTWRLFLQCLPLALIAVQGWVMLRDEAGGGARRGAQGQ